MDRQDLIKITTNINKESCPGFVNFHCHTKFSDGSFDPEQLLDQAFINKIKFISITAVSYTHLTLPTKRIV